MSLTEDQLGTINGIDSKGLHLNEGAPCECGGEHYSTSKHRKYSDAMLYKHNCNECGNKFSTWTQG